MTDVAPILLAGMFDMDNYGDLLFPLLAARRLAAAGMPVLPVAPAGGQPSFRDALPPIGVAAMLDEQLQIGGILIGGGYLIHTSRLDFLDHYRGAAAGEWGGPGLWIGATLAAALRDVPVAWNAPGVPHPFGARQQRVVNAALRAASYVAVRDQGSRTLLAPPSDVVADVVPDPAVDLPLLWSRKELADPFHNLLARKGLPQETRLLAIHVRNRSITGEDAAWLATALACLAARRGLVPMLAAVGESHDDPTIARQLARMMPGPRLLLDDPLDLREMTAALAHSAFYVGASLHGYIATAAYGAPGVLVARPAYQKFAGFLQHVSRMQDLAGDWHAALDLAAKPRAPVPLPAAVTTAVDRHWDTIIACLRAPDHRGAARAAFVRALLRAGIDRHGPGWAMQPIIQRRGTP